MICPDLLAGVLANLNSALLLKEDSKERKAIDSWAQCRGENCQKWDKARGDCGLKAIAPDPELMGIVKENAEWSRKLMADAGDEGVPV